VQRVVEDLKDPLMFEEIERKVKFKFVDLETGRDEGTQVRAKVCLSVCLSVFLSVSLSLSLCLSLSLWRRDDEGTQVRAKVLQSPGSLLKPCLSLSTNQSE
jgi:hypothetical protein